MVFKIFNKTGDTNLVRLDLAQSESPISKCAKFGCLAYKAINLMKTTTALAGMHKLSTINGVNGGGISQWG